MIKNQFEILVRNSVKTYNVFLDYEVDATYLVPASLDPHTELNWRSGVILWKVRDSCLEVDCVFLGNWVLMNGENRINIDISIHL